MILSQLGARVTTDYHGDYIRCNVNLLSTVLGWVFHCSYGQNIYKLFSAKQIVCHNDQILYAHYTGKESRYNLQEYNSVKIFVYPSPNINIYQITTVDIHIQNFVHGNQRDCYHFLIGRYLAKILHALMSITG